MGFSLFIEDETGDDDYPEELLGHDDRCNAPAGGGCSCRQWEDFDERRREQEEDEQAEDAVWNEVAEPWMT